MIRTTIMRTIPTSVIHACGVDVVDGKPNLVHLEPLVAHGKLKESEALKLLKSEYGKNKAFQITKISVHENTYKISVDDFIKYATLVPNGSDTSEPK